MCEKCGHQLAEACGQEVCGFCFGKALEAGTMPPKGRPGTAPVTHIRPQINHGEGTEKGGPNG